MYFALCLSFAVIGCDSDSNPEPEINYEFEGVVLGKGIDCGDTYLVDLKKKNGDSDIKSGTYYADNLPQEFKVKGYKMKMNCRKPNSEEAYPCATLGLGYNHVIVMESIRVPN